MFGDKRHICSRRQFVPERASTGYSQSHSHKGRRNGARAFAATDRGRAPIAGFENAFKLTFCCLFFRGLIREMRREESRTSKAIALPFRGDHKACVLTYHRLIYQELPFVRVPLEDPRKLRPLHPDITQCEATTALNPNAMCVHPREYERRC